MEKVIYHITYVAIFFFLIKQHHVINKHFRFFIFKLQNLLFFSSEICSSSFSSSTVFFFFFFKLQPSFHCVQVISKIFIVSSSFSFVSSKLQFKVISHFNFSSIQTYIIPIFVPSSLFLFKTPLIVFLVFIDTFILKKLLCTNLVFFTTLIAITTTSL